MINVYAAIRYAKGKLPENGFAIICSPNHLVFVKDKGELLSQLGKVMDGNFVPFRFPEGPAYGIRPVGRRNDEERFFLISVSIEVKEEFIKKFVQFD